MKKLMFLIVAFLAVACNESPRLSSVNLPNYKLVSIDVPRVSANGKISPTQNLVYNIEIEEPMQKDQLGLLQDYFIRKGKEDYAGVNKVIVRAYLKGTSSYGTPYASLNLIGEKKEILINESAIKLEALTGKPVTANEEPVTTTAQKKVDDPFIGKYYCQRTHDTYVFNADNTGFFVIQGGGPSEFTWKRSGDNVTIMYEVFGEQKLRYNPKAETITEKSESFGTLLFEKQ